MQDPSSGFASKSKLPKRKNLARNISIAIGVIAAVLTITSIVLLVIIRDTSTKTSTIKPSETPIPTPTNIDKITLKNFENTQQFTFGDFTTIKPITSVGDATDANGCLNTSSDSKDAHIIQPGEIKFESSIDTPLQVPPQGYGWLIMTPSTDQWFTSFENGYSSFGQYEFASNSKDQSKTTYTVVEDAYKTGRNFIYFNCRQSKKRVKVNPDVSAVGSIGPQSICISDDGLRLYIGYQIPSGDAEGASLFPFVSFTGQVATFTRPLDKTGNFSTSTNWNFSCTLQLNSPFSLVQNTTYFNDPIQKKLILGDQFGQIIQASRNRINGNRIVAIRSNFGFLREEGAVICIYEENIKNDVHDSSGVLSLSGDHGKFTFTSDDKLVFGHHFDVGNDVILANILTQNKVVVFYRQDGDDFTWKFHSLIESPNTGQEFGRSIALDPTGRLALIGSPTIASTNVNNVSTGGSVYLYSRGDDNEWTLRDTLNDPNPSINKSGVFGYFVKTDVNFLIASISTNQNSTLGVKPTKDSASENQLPKITLVSIDQKNKKIISENSEKKIVTVSQNYENGKSFIDQTFGSSVSLESTNENHTRIHLMTGSPLNQIVEWRIMNL